MTVIDEILSLLKDGQWHNLKEITEKVTQSQNTTDTIVGFLEKYDFIHLNENTKEARLQSLLLKFIQAI